MSISQSLSSTPDIFETMNTLEMSAIQRSTTRLKAYFQYWIFFCRKITENLKTHCKLMDWLNFVKYCHCKMWVLEKNRLVLTVWQLVTTLADLNKKWVIQLDQLYYTKDVSAWCILQTQLFCLLQKMKSLISLQTSTLWAEYHDTKSKVMDCCLLHALECSRLLVPVYCNQTRDERVK